MGAGLTTEPEEMGQVPYGSPITVDVFGFGAAP